MQSKAIVFHTIGFSLPVEHVLSKDTGWPELLDAVSVMEHDKAVDYVQLADDAAVGCVAAAVVAPVTQQLQIIQQLRTASSMLFIACW